MLVGMGWFNFNHNYNHFKKFQQILVNGLAFIMVLSFGAPQNGLNS